MGSFCTQVANVIKSGDNSRFSSGESVTTLAKRKNKISPQTLEIILFLIQFKLILDTKILDDTKSSILYAKRKLKMQKEKGQS